MNVGAWVRDEAIGDEGRMVATSLGFGVASADERGGRCEDISVDHCANFGGQGELGAIRRGRSGGFHGGWWDE